MGEEVISMTNRTRPLLKLQDPDNPTQPSMRLAITQAPTAQKLRAPRRSRAMATTSPFDDAYMAAYDAAIITSDLLWAGIGNPYSEQEQAQAAVSRG